MHVNYTFVALLAALLAAPSVPADSAQLSLAVDRANKLYSSAQTFGALKLWRMAQAGPPPVAAAAYCNMASVLQTMGLPDLPRELYRSAISVEPSSESAYASLGQTLAHEGRWSEARKALLSSIGISKSSDSSRDSEISRMAQHNLAVTEQMINQASQLIRAGQQARDRAELNQAVRLFGEALSVSPFNAIGYNNLACTHGSNGNSALALELFQFAVYLDPQYAKVAACCWASCSHLFAAS